MKIAQNRNKIAFFTVSAAVFLAVSCGTTKEIENETQSSSEEIISEPEVEIVDNDFSPSENQEIAEEEKTEPIAEEKEPSDFEKFVLKTSSLYSESIRIESPKETVCGKAFSSPFVFFCTNEDGDAVSGFDLLVQFPIKRELDENGSKTDEKIEFVKTKVTTNENGKATFLPPIPLEPILSEISAEPYFDENSADAARIAKESQKYRTSAPFSVRTNKFSAGGIISLVEIQADGSVLRGDSLASSKLLTAMMRQRFTSVGNAIFTDSVVSGKREKVFEEAKKLTANGMGKMAYIVFGTMKKINSEKGGAFECAVDCISLADGSELYSTVCIGEGKSDAEARVNAANAIAAKLVYGL